MLEFIFYIVAVLTIGWGCFPYFREIYPFSTGHGSFPLFEIKLFDNILASGVRAKSLDEVFFFLFDSAIALAIIFSISLSIFAVFCCFNLISLRYLV